LFLKEWIIFEKFIDIKITYSLPKLQAEAAAGNPPSIKEMRDFLHIPAIPDTYTDRQ
jgi:hypothetical protein